MCRMRKGVLYFVMPAHTSIILPTCIFCFASCFHIISYMNVMIISSQKARIRSTYFAWYYSYRLVSKKSNKVLPKINTFFLLSALINIYFFLKYINEHIFLILRKKKIGESKHTYPNLYLYLWTIETKHSAFFYHLTIFLKVSLYKIRI